MIRVNIEKNYRNWQIIENDLPVIKATRPKWYSSDVKFFYNGIKISKKYENLYEIDESEMPTDIQVMINNNEIGSTLLRIIEVIGQDDLETLDDDTLYFVISALNQLDIDYIRNKILLKVLPLKV